MRQRTALLAWNPELFNVCQEIGRVGIDAKGAGAFEILLAIASRQQAHTESAFSSGSQ